MGFLSKFFNAQKYLDPLAPRFTADINRKVGLEGDKGKSGQSGGTVDPATGMVTGTDNTRANLAALLAAQSRPTNIGLPTALPQTQTGGIDYRAMLAALQQGQGIGQMPGYNGLQGMRYAPGAGFLPQQQMLSLPALPQAQQMPQIPATTQPAAQNLGLGGLSRYITFNDPYMGPLR